MALLDKLKSLLGLDDGQSGSDRQGSDEVGVTVEHEPGAAEPAEEAPPASPAPGSGAAEPEPAAESEPEPTAASDPDPDVDPEVEPPAAEDTVDESTEELDGRGSTDEPGTEPRSGPEPDEEESPSQPESEPLETVDPEPEPEPADDAPATEAGADEGSVRDIKGIGPSYETKLSEAGIDSAADLAAADAGELSAETGLSEKRIQGWIDRARAR